MSRKKVKKETIVFPSWREAEEFRMNRAIEAAEKHKRLACDTVQGAIDFFRKRDQWAELRDLSLMKVHACRAWASAGRVWVDEWNRAFDVAREEIEKSRKMEDDR